MDSSKREDISAYILAGGESRRFGENKALASFQGKPLMSLVLEMLSACFSKVYVVAKPGSGYKNLGYPIVEDVFPDQTPLVGIYTGLLHSDTDWNFFAGCDMPLLTGEVIEWMIMTLDKSQGPVEVILPAGPYGIEPLAALYHRSLKDAVLQQHKTIALRSFIRSRKYETVHFESIKPFTNVNTKAQLARIGG